MTMQMNEASLMSLAADYLRQCGWMCAHFRQAQTAAGWRTPVQYDGAGFPDLAAARNGVVRLIEVKGPRGKLSPQQQQWLQASNGYLLTPDNVEEFISEFR